MVYIDDSDLVNPMQSAVDTTFWAELQRLKLGELQLSERPVPCQGVHLGWGLTFDAISPVRSEPAEAMFNPKLL